MMLIPSFKKILELVPGFLPHHIPHYSKIYYQTKFPDPSLNYAAVNPTSELHTTDMLVFQTELGSTNVRCL
jgi:hypothetical protein